jgi:fatty-acid peroxygenase
MQALLASGIGLAMAGVAARSRHPLLRLALVAGGAALARRAIRADRTLALAADPYRFIGRMCRAHDVDAFETRLLLQPAVCMRGAAAARLFYDEAHMRRVDAAPEPLRATLFGKGAVQSLDGVAHRQRKGFFLTVTRPEHVAALARRTRLEWDRAIERWTRTRSIALYAEAQVVLTRAVFAWAGVPLGERDVKRRTRQIAALFDAAAGNPARHVAARIARRRLESWLAALVRDVRAGVVTPLSGSALEEIAFWPDENGRPLASRVAAVELLNVLRPTVAVAVYIVFAAHALTRYPAWQDALAAAERRTGAGGREPGASHDEVLTAFAQEVRRAYPFFPAVMARARHDFAWGGVHFGEGDRVLLDLYGTNHDPALWRDPQSFRPERFLGDAPPPFAFVPQGGGDVATGHRCPGEGITLALMKVAIDVLTRRVRFAVPRQDLRVDFGRLPALPNDRFRMTDIRVAEPARVGGTPAPAAAPVRV